MISIPKTYKPDAGGVGTIYEFVRGSGTKIITIADSTTNCQGRPWGTVILDSNLDN